MIGLPLLFNWSIELWVVILMSALGISFLAVVICSIILGKEIAKKITELDEKTRKTIQSLSNPELRPGSEK
jgi:hypothetical protein